MQSGTLIQEELSYQMFSNLVLLKVSFYRRNAILWPLCCTGRLLTAWCMTRIWGHSAGGKYACSNAISPSKNKCLCPYSTVFLINLMPLLTCTFTRCAIWRPPLQVILWLPISVSEEQWFSSVNSRQHREVYSNCL